MDSQQIILFMNTPVEDLVPCLLCRGKWPVDRTVTLHNRWAHDQQIVVCRGCAEGLPSKWLPADVLPSHGMVRRSQTQTGTVTVTVVC